MRISREDAAQKILHSNGKMFSVTWKTKDGRLRRLNGKFTRLVGDRRNQDKIFGLFTVKESRSGRVRRVDARTIRELHINRNQYKVG